MGDVDLWALSVSPEEGAEAVAEGGGTVALTVNPKWLQHLQERLLAEDGHPRKVGRDGFSFEVTVAAVLKPTMPAV